MGKNKFTFSGIYTKIAWKFTHVHRRDNQSDLIFYAYLIIPISWQI